MQRRRPKAAVPDGACSVCKAVVDGPDVLSCNGGCGLLIHRKCLPAQIVILDAQPAGGHAEAATPPGPSKRSARLSSPNCKSARRKSCVDSLEEGEYVGNRLTDSGVKAV